MECVEEESKGAVERIEELRVEWKRLWRERFDDKVRAECVANKDYSSLYVEKGTVIFATRNFKSLSFKGILEERGVSDAYRFVSPNPGIGGWGKFIKSSVLHGTPTGKHLSSRRFVEEEKKPQQLKKGGRGWLHR